MIAEVIVDIASSEVDRIFDYICSDELCEGMRVAVPFGPREIEGYIIRIKDKSELDASKLKPIIRALEPYPVIRAEFLELMRYMTGKYHIRLVDALRLFIPAEMRRERVKELSARFVRLSDEYRGGKYAAELRKNSFAMSELCEYLDSTGEVSSAELNKSFSAAALRNLIARGIVQSREAEVRREPYKGICGGDSDRVTLTDAQKNAFSAMAGKDGVFVLHGVTGSGKTEVYMRLIEHAAKSGKTAIMLVPEIGLTPQVMASFRARFGDGVALLHSGLSAGERFDEWRRLLSGEATIAIGARSAVFAPLVDVGVIIIDEEHETSYVSDSNPRYITGEIAAFRRCFHSCALVLGSATPSVETYYKATTGEYSLVELPDRINKKMPEIIITDMRRERRSGAVNFSSALLSEIDACLKNRNQAMLFLNRRGFASFVMCRACGYVAKCSDCDVSLVYHRSEDMLKCHYCANRFAALDCCPECGEPVRMGYIGTEKVEELIKEEFPSARVLRMDNDTTRGKDAHYEILAKFRRREADILVGTQMIAKGHDFPLVSVVGIIDADMSLHYSDYRATERTYQLITQMSGRAGRGLTEGKVILQTYMPNHYVYKFAAAADYTGFYSKEINIREVTKYPPFTQIVRVLISSGDDGKASSVLKGIYEGLREYFREVQGQPVYFGAMRSPLRRIQNKFRYQILMRLRGDCSAQTLAETYRLIDEFADKDVSVFADLNPQNMS